MVDLFIRTPNFRFMHYSIECIIVTSIIQEESVNVIKIIAVFSEKQCPRTHAVRRMSCYRILYHLVHIISTASVWIWQERAKQQQNTLVFSAQP